MGWKSVAPFYIATLIERVYNEICFDGLMYHFI